MLRATFLITLQCYYSMWFGKELPSPSTLPSYFLWWYSGSPETFNHISALPSLLLTFLISPSACTPPQLSGSSLDSIHQLCVPDALVIAVSVAAFV